MFPILASTDIFSGHLAMLPTDPPFCPPVTTLETARLSIRVDAHERYVEVFRTYSDAALKAYTGITSDEDLQKQKDKVWGGLTTYRTSVVFFHLIERSMDKVIGSFAFHNWYPIHNRSEIGYAMAAEEYKNKGYMREALPPIIAFGFEAMQLNRAEAFISPDNTASRRLVERVGFRQEGWLKEHFSYNGVLDDSLVYGLIRKDYLGNVDNAARV
jgi:[ribosomal protein S5]-alanine N-acetyltransferase